MSKKQNNRLVSYEPSHSWLKRTDELGTQVIQAGYRLNPVGRFLKNDENPLVLVDGETRWYGQEACQGAHESPLSQRKEVEPRFGFAACLRPSDHGKALTVVVSHWDEDTGNRIAQSLIGSYQVTRNGHTVQCQVVKATAQLEDQGTYQAVLPLLKPGKTLLIGSGYGTSQEWLIGQNGFFQGQATENLAVKNLAMAIAADPVVRDAAIRLGEQTVNLDLVAQALKTGTFGSLDQATWSSIRSKYVAKWFEGFKGYLVKAYGTELQAVSNVVFSGGGAELIRDRVGGFAIVPGDAQTASVRGAYAHHATVGGIR